jgi:hypothetical protein
MTAGALARLDHLAEPRLVFGHGQEMEHPKDGLFLFGPLREAGAPAEMRIGVIGTDQGLERFRRWSADIKRFIPPMRPDTPHHAAFPGFEAVFGARWPDQPMAKLTVSGEEIARALRLSFRHEAIFETVSIFERRIREFIRREDAAPALWFVVIPEDVHRYGRPKSVVPKAERVQSDFRITARIARQVLEQGSLFSEERQAAELLRYEVNFHEQLKARLLDANAVVQIVRETTLTPGDFVVDGRPMRDLQDPATVAWNLCMTAYFKAGGKPYKLAGVRPGVCYVGLVFKRDGTSPTIAGNACCGAQMFLNSGDGVVFRGAVGPWYSPSSKEFHLPEHRAAELMKLVIDAYAEVHGVAPAELFIHGRARFDAAEWAGFSSVVPPETNLVGVRIRDSGDLKLFRRGRHPVLRGTAYRLDERLGYLWTSGFVPRLATYPGWEVPNPLMIEINRGDGDLLRVMRDVMRLTKVNFNACEFADGLPVTLKFADAVGEILTAAPIPDLPPLPFRFYI